MYSYGKCVRYLMGKARCKRRYIPSSYYSCFNNNKTYFMNKTQRNNHTTVHSCGQGSSGIELHSGNGEPLNMCTDKQTFVLYKSSIHSTTA